MKKLLTNRHLLWWTIAAVVLSACNICPAQAPDLPFDSGSTGEDGPLTFRPHITPGRGRHGIVFDAARGQLVFFGGGWLDALGASVLYNTTFVWSGATWVAKSPSNLPPGRLGHAMAYDAARGEVVICGGWLGSRLDDTWVWNGTNWTRKSLGTPGARHDASMAYDATRQQIVLFGGVPDSGVALNETWLWNGTNWNLINPATRPPARYHHSMTYDAKNQEIVMFGGYTRSGTSDISMNDTWTWNGTNWSLKTPSNAPSARYTSAMTYDALRQQVVLHGGGVRNLGFDDTWIWDGTNWQQKLPATTPGAHAGHAMAYDPNSTHIVMSGMTSRHGNDTWFWDGTNWAAWSGVPFDMNARPSGVWNFTSIDVPVGVTVTFKKNAANTPVRWLASSNVTINGSVILDGEDSFGGGLDVRQSEGGPGGFAGGRGGVPFNQGGSYAGTPGQGPGGGNPGVTDHFDGFDGMYAGTYGNSYLQPLIGGSGGGGEGSTISAYGFNGAGGGGALLLASSRDILINGTVQAIGGRAQAFFNANFKGGWGSGGALRLRADRITVRGTLAARNDVRDDGRIRLESYYRDITGSVRGSTVISGPVVNQQFETPENPLVITSVAGENVLQPPGGNPVYPDVIFTADGNVSVSVTASQTVPDGTPVRLRVTTSASVINVPASPLVNRIVNFVVAVPKGAGTIQAFADFTLTAQ